MAGIRKFFGLFVAAAALAAFAVPATAHLYKLTNFPPSIPAGGTLTNVVVGVQNTTPDSITNFNSFKLTAPSGITITAASVPTGSTYNGVVAISGNTVTVKNISPSVKKPNTFNLKLSLSAACTGGGNWTPHVYSGSQLNGSEFIPTNSVSTAVSGTCPKLTYTAGPNGTISGASPQTVSYGGTGTPVTAVPNTGYRFVNWSDGSTANPRTDTNVASSISVTANFAINTFTLTYTAGPNGSLTGTSPQTVNYGGSGTTVTAVPATGYNFAGWSDGVATAARTDTNVTANKNVSASFTINTYTLTYTAGANGSLTGTSPQTVNYGGSGTPVTAVPNAGYSFASWSDGLLTPSRTDTNVTVNIVVTASFVANTLTISAPKPTSSAVATPFAVVVVTSPGAPPVSMNSDCGATSTSTISGNSTTFSVTIATAPPQPGVCNLTFSATNYPSAPLSLKVLAAQVATCQPDTSTPPPTGAQFTASCGDASSINVTGFAAGFRGPNKAGTCDALNFTLTNNICGAAVQQDANGNFIPPNAVSFVWDQSSQSAAFTYTVTWNAEYVDATTGLPRVGRTQYCIGTDPTAPCGDPTIPTDPNRVPLQACISSDVAFTSIPTGQKACMTEEDWATVSQTACAALTNPNAPNPPPACIRVTTTIIDAKDPPIIRP